MHRRRVLKALAPSFRVVAEGTLVCATDFAAFEVEGAELSCMGTYRRSGGT